MAGAQRVALSFTSWFRVPEQGMKRFEVLSRASAFAVTSKQAPKNAVHIVAALHVPCPFLFRNYYPLSDYPWLSAVEDKHVRSRVEFRKRGTGKLLGHFDLNDNIWAHHERDMCVMHLEDEPAFVAACAEHGLEALSLASAADLEPGTPLNFHGHVLPDFPAPEDDEGMQTPQVVAGSYELKSPAQWFASTKETLSMGMCGGPVLRGDGKCLGMLEGIVPDHPEPDTLPASHRRVLNHAAFIPSDEIIGLLEAVEDKMRQEAEAKEGEEEGEKEVHTPMLTADDLPDAFKR